MPWLLSVLQLALFVAVVTGGTPTGQPTRQPTRQPSSQPSRQPSRQPTSRPTQPTGQPTRQPSRQPSGQPSKHPSGQPSSQPTQPTGQPSGQPSSEPSGLPSSEPSAHPSVQPSGEPSGQPSSQPSSPSSSPTRAPAAPTTEPTNFEVINAYSWGSWLMILVALLVLFIVAWRILVMKRHRIQRLLSKALTSMLGRSTPPVASKRGQGQGRSEGGEKNSAKIYVTTMTQGLVEEEGEDEEQGLAFTAFGLDEIDEQKQTRALPPSIKAPPPPGLPPSVLFRSSSKPEFDRVRDRDYDREGDERGMDTEAGTGIGIGIEQDEREYRPSRRRRSDKEDSRSRSRSRSRRVKAVSIRVTDLLVGLPAAELARLSASPEELQARLEQALGGGRGIRDEGAEKETDDVED